MDKLINLNQLYNLMYDQMDPTGWWPGRSDWEVIWSTILIQNTNWKNVAQASQSLYQATEFSPERIIQLSNSELEKVIASAGFKTRKAQTIKNVANYFKIHFDYDLEKAQQQNKKQLRKEILALKGIGPETADVILMYGLRKGEFVVDTYARRLFACLGWKTIPPYEKAKLIIENNLRNFTLRNYQNFHAMIDTFNQEYHLPNEFTHSFLNGYRLQIPTNKKEIGLK